MTQKTRRALVLGGGGAKGAFVFGCLLAFAEAGLQFDYVAGTSVGALNAVLWSSNSLEEGKDIWREINYDNIYPVTILNVKLFGRIASIAIGFLCVISRVFWWILGDKVSPSSRITSAIMSIIGILPLMSMFFIFRFTSKDSLDYFFAVVIIVIILLTYYLILTNQRANSSYYFFPLFVQGIFIFFIGIFSRASLSQNIILAFGFLATIFSGLFFCLVFNNIHQENVSVLSSEPLREKARNILKSKPLLIPTIVAVARHTNVFDPDNPKWMTYDIDVDGCAKYYAQWDPNGRPAWTADYVRIDQLEPEDSLQFCLASAAMPYGIVPPVKVYGQVYYDGGVNDNCPVYPFIDNMDIDEIFVIIPSKFKSDEEAIVKVGLTLDAWCNRQREREVAMFPFPNGNCRFADIPYKDRNRPPRIIPYREPSHFPRMIPFYSLHNPLGNFITGTLRFESDYAANAIRIGYIETRQRLLEFGIVQELSPIDEMLQGKS